MTSTPLLLAHARHCSRAELGTTVVIAAAVAALLLRPWRQAPPRRRSSLGMCVVIVGALTLAACGGGDDPADEAAPERPTSSAQLRIVKPVANEETGPDTTVELELIGGRVVDRTTGPLRGDEGHLHLSVDGKLVSMAYGTTQELRDLAPGTHTVQAEFVAADHVPFRNRVVAAVIFRVKAP